VKKTTNVPNARLTLEFNRQSLPGIKGQAFEMLLK
jgi:hypothetical protein